MTLTKSLVSLALVAGSFGFVACNELIQDKTSKGVIEKHTVHSTKKSKTDIYYEATITFINHKLVSITSYEHLQR